MIKHIGSQSREPLTDTDYRILEYVKGTRKREVVLWDAVAQKAELWIRRNDFAGYVVEIDGIGYEFMRSL